MRLKEQSYSVLIVSNSEAVNETLTGIFSVPEFSPVTAVSSVSAARRALSERAFDIVVINSPLPDDAGIRFAVDSVDADVSVVLFLVREEQFGDACDKLAPHGIFLLQKPVSVSLLRVAAGWLVSARERIRKTEKKTLSIEEKIHEIRLVNRAKWLLISELQMTEPEAHRYIEKQAMDRCVTRRQISEEIIRTYG